MKNQIIVKEHSKVSSQEVLNICKIKSIFGKYSLDSQLKWLDNNINQDDIHFMLQEESSLVAYLNLIKISVEINNKQYNCLGIGNVCSIKKGKGYGKVIMEKLNIYLTHNNIIGLLFCKDELVPFYKLFHWDLICAENVTILLNDININTMVFNKTNIYSIKYTSKSF